MGSQVPKLTTSDAELIESARSGDTSAFGELWHRHFRSAARVARQFTSIDADDLVSEAYARIFQRVLAGGGPTGAFRPYLYTTIRNLASTWGAASRDIQVDMIEEFEDERIPDDPATWALDRTLTARAFRSLPERWQSVLWYTEVEGMDPHEVAPLMGMTANGVAALSYRAREGLRKAWLQAHISDATASGECQWTLARLGDHARDGLSNRDRQRVLAHLVGCPKCTIVSEEVNEVGSHLALVMLPLILGGVAGGGLLAALSSPSSAMAEAVPAMPHAVEAIATAATGAGAIAAPVLGGISLGAATGTATLVGSLTVAALLTGGIATGLAPHADPVAAAPSPSTSQQLDPVSARSLLDPSPSPSSTPGADAIPDVLPTSTPTPVPDAAGSADSSSGLGGVVGGVTGDVSNTVGSLIDTVTGGATPPPGHTAPGGLVGADISLNLSGTGTPGAHVSLQAAGQVYATTTVGPDGTFQLNVSAIPGGLSSLALVQTVDRSYLLNSLGLGGLVGNLLGTVDNLVNALIKPLHLDSLPGGISIRLLN